jgi:hypothetical protein
MSIFGTNKKIILSSLLIALVIAGVFGLGHGVFAAEESAAGKAFGDILGSTGWWWGLMLGFVLVVQAVFATLLVFAGYLLNVMFNINIGFVPSLEPVVQVGWTVLRDITNGVFIILVLWIALTIILNIEQYGGKKLLAKVLAVAILINFSLAIVTAVVVLSNQFAKAFSDKISEGTKKDLPKYIVGITQFQSITASLTNDQLDQQQKVAKEEADRMRAGEGAITFSDQFREGMFASVGFHSARAVDITQCTNTKTTCYQTAGCIVPTDTNPEPVQPRTCDTAKMSQCDVEDGQCIANLQSTQGASLLVRAAGFGGQYEYLTSLYESAKTQLGDWTKVTFARLLQISISVVLLVIVVSTFLYAAVALGMRFFAVIFLAIAAPIAFFTFAIPGGMGKKMWDEWWNSFLKWVFFAPAFYFLIYLTLLMAGQMNTAFSGQPGTAAITTDGRRLLGLFVVLGLLLYASRLAKKTAGKAGEFTVGLAKKLGGLAVGVTAGVATGGTLLAARGLARGMVKPGTKRAAVMGRVARYVPGGAAIQRYGAQKFEERKKDIEERKKTYAPLSNDQVYSDFRGAMNLGIRGTTRENAARLGTLIERPGGIDLLSQSERKFAQNVFEQYGMGDAIAKVAPTLATEKSLTAKGREDIRTNTKKNKANNNEAYAADPTRYIAENMAPADIDKINTSEIKEGKNDNNELKAAKKKLREGFARNSRFGMTQITALALKDMQAAQEQVDEMNNVFKELNKEIEAETAKGDKGDKELIARGNRRVAQIKETARQFNYTTGGRALGITLKTNAPDDLGSVADAAGQQRRGGNRPPQTTPPTPTPTPAPTPPPTP